MTILAEIEAFLKATEMRPSTFGRKTVNDAHLVERLRRGGDVLSTTAIKLRHFMKTAAREDVGSREDAA